MKEFGLSVGNVHQMKVQTTNDNIDSMTTLKNHLGFIATKQAIREMKHKRLVTKLKQIFGGSYSIPDD